MRALKIQSLIKIEYNTHIYTLEDGPSGLNYDNSKFTISGNQLITNSEIDFETQSEYIIYMEAFDGLNILGKERKICFAELLIGFSIFEIGCLIFMQVAFFYAQSTEYLSSAPAIYFWLYGQILALYVGLGVSFCYIFRGFCQDQYLEEDSMRRM